MSLLVRRVLTLGALFGASAFAADKPAAVQLCLTLPAGVALYADKPQPNYRAIGPDTYLLDADLRLNGALVDKLTRDGNQCLRGWVAATNLKSLSLNFDRTTFNLAPVKRSIDLKLKPDLWYSAGSFSVERAPWVRVTTSLPGALKLSRQAPAGAVEITDFEHVPAGTYHVSYEAPARPTGPCEVTVKAIGLGTIRADNKPEFFAQLVEEYRTDLLPAVLKQQKVVCTDLEALEVEVKLRDGVFVAPADPAVRRIVQQSKKPRYVLTSASGRLPFESGETFVFTAGQQVTLEQVTTEGPLAKRP